MTSVKEENKQVDIDEIDSENTNKINNSNLENNSKEINNQESENKSEKSFDKNEITDLKDNAKIQDDNENKEILSNEKTDEKNLEKKTEKEKDENEDEKDNKSENKEIKNKSEIKSLQVNNGNQSYDNNNSNMELKDENDNYIKKDKKYRNENMIKEVLSPSYSNISYRPSEYRSILQNTELTESDRLLIEKYSNYKNNNYNLNNNDLCVNIDFSKKLTYNYQNYEEPKTINYLSKYQYNTIEVTPKQYLKNNYISNSKSPLENENEKPKTYLERNNLIINNIGKDVNFSWDNIIDKPYKKIGKNNSEKILFTNSPFQIDITNSYKPNKNGENLDYIRSLKGDYSNKRNLNKENEDFNLNINYSYNISRNSDKNQKNQNLLNNTSLANYHIPHTQSSIIKKYIPNYSIFDFHRYNNYKSNSSSIPNINKYSKDIYGYDLQNITNNYNQNMYSNTSQYNNYSINANANNNNKSILNYESKNVNNANDDSLINNNKKSLENSNKSSQSIERNEKPLIKKVNNSKKLLSNSLSIPKYNSKKYKSLLFDEDKKESFILDNKNVEQYYNHNKYFNKSDIQNNLGHYENRRDLFHPHHCYPKLNQNKNDFIINRKKGGAFRADTKMVIIKSSPSDFYYSTMHKEYIPKTQNIGRKSKTQFSRTYQIDENKDMNNKKNLLYFSTIRRDLIDKNKRRKFQGL